MVPCMPPLGTAFSENEEQSHSIWGADMCDTDLLVYVQDTSPTDRRPVVCVSKAQLVGENNYRRAWAYFADLARTAADGPFTCPSED
eukprot:scaffold273160_cov55-Attheya_sp.AAC.2